MKALAIAPGQRAIGVLDLPFPERDGQVGVLVRMLEVGICGTDREIARFEYGTPPPGEPGLVIGHESLAEVIEAGPGAGLAEGDLVVTMVRRPCSDPGCRPCRAGRADFCRTGRYAERGISSRHGFMAEYVTDRPEFMIRVPAELRGVAVLTEPLTIAEKALEQVWALQRRLPWTDPAAPPQEPGRGLRAVVLGAGPVGLLGAMALLEAGFDTTVYSRSPAPNAKAAVTQAIGARYVSAEQHDLDALAAAAGPPDLVYEATGAAQAALAATRILAPNGAFVLTGVPRAQAPRLLDSSGLMRRVVLGNQVIVGTVNAGHDSYVAAVATLGRFYRRWPGELAALITGRHSLEAAAGVLTGEPSGIKDIVVLDGPVPR
jgi:threonine dehydrogenase-like Zn-dependent dehydrogenase